MITESGLSDIVSERMSRLWILKGLDRKKMRSSYD